MKPQVFSPREKYSIIRGIGRGWREAAIHLPPFSMVLVEVSMDLQTPGALPDRLEPAQHKPAVGAFGKFSLLTTICIIS